MIKENGFYIIVLEVRKSCPFMAYNKLKSIVLHTLGLVSVLVTPRSHFRIMPKRRESEPL